LSIKANIAVNANPWALIAPNAGGCRPPLADRGTTGERRIARAEPIGRTPVKHGLRYLGSPGDAALARFAAIPRIVAQRL
jgi:hypothetical protein